MRLVLRYSSLSPFARKVRVFAHEIGLGDRLELSECDVWANDSDIIRDNPYAKVPVLLTDDGTFLGSTLCCEFLDSLHAGERLVPPGPPARWPVLQRHALGDGLMEAAVAHVTEQLRRPSQYVYQGYLDRQAAKIQRGLDMLEPQVAAFAARTDLASITLACALGYLDLRLPQLGWRAGRRALAEWFGIFGARPSMLATQPRR